MKLSLVVMAEGKSAGKTIAIPSAQFIIGRDPQCNLRPGSAMISKRHCALLVKSGQAFLRDFDSTNGTFLNDQPVKGEVPIKDGDLLKVGPLVFKIVLETAPVSAPAKSTPLPPTPAPMPPKSNMPMPPKSNIMDDDAAALLLDTDNEIVSTDTHSDTANEVPGGTTLMEVPVLPAPADASKEGAPAAEGQAADSKPPAPKAPDPKKVNKTGAAQEAAQAILAKLRAGKRK